MGKLDDKVAIITGAGSGIGEATTKLFLEEGALVVAIDTTKESLDKYKDNSKVLSIYGDVTSNGEIDRMIDEVGLQHKGIDILCNMLISEDSNGWIEDAKKNLWDELISLDVNDSFLLSKKVVGIMEKRNRGVILNVDSCLDLNYYKGNQGGLRLTKVMASGLISKGIRTNCISYGCTQSDVERILNEDENSKYLLNIKSRFSANDYVEPIDVARAALFLCSDDSKHINGAILPVDNGMSCC